MPLMLPMLTMEPRTPCATITLQRSRMAHHHYCESCASCPCFVSLIVPLCGRNLGGGATAPSTQHSRPCHVAIERKCARLLTASSHAKLLPNHRVQTCRNIPSLDIGRFQHRVWSVQRVTSGKIANMAGAFESRQKCVLSPGGVHHAKEDAAVVEAHGGVEIGSLHLVNI